MPLFVIFEILGGCKCCERGQRETILPGTWKLAGMELDELLALPHNVSPDRIELVILSPADKLTREKADELRRIARA